MTTQAAITNVGGMALHIPADLFPAGFEPDPAQVAAVAAAANHKVFVLTGGPGVGKTFTTNAILRMLAANGLIDVRCCAFAGKAALRMKQLTGQDATTIHRLLGFGGTDGSFKHHAGERLDCDVVVLDEASMVDIKLFAALMCAIPSHARVIIVGDVDQLPAIGAGTVLADLLASGVVPCVRLTKIWRQADVSAIPHAAKDINQGRTPDFAAYSKAGDLRFAEVGRTDDVLYAIQLAFDRAGNHGFTHDDVQVLLPQRSTAIGIEAVNLMLQAHLNGDPNRDGATTVGIGSGYKAQTGDRVIHTTNDYKLCVMNGEIGKVTAVNWRGFDKLPKGCEHSDRNPEDGTLNPDVDASERVLIVAYPDRAVAYTRQEIKMLELAFAVTIHKSQGSAFPLVVTVAHNAYADHMMTRALLYTAITRTEKMCILIGETKTVTKAARNIGPTRNSTLQGRLQPAEAA